MTTTGRHSPQPHPCWPGVGRSRQFRLRPINSCRSDCRPSSLRLASPRSSSSANLNQPCARVSPDGQTVTVKQPNWSRPLAEAVRAAAFVLVLKPARLVDQLCERADVLEMDKTNDDARLALAE